MEHDKGKNSNADRVKQRTQYHRKRKKVFCTKKSVFENVEKNLNTERNNSVCSDSSMNSSVSSKKIRSISSTTPTKLKNISGFRLVDMVILAAVFALLLPCPLCSSSLHLAENLKKNKGWRLCSTLFAKAAITKTIFTHHEHTLRIVFSK